MRIAIECTWSSAGEVELRADQLALPPLPDEPGVYQWVFRHDGRERRYVGEAATLRRRFQHYRTPGPTQSTNLRMRERAIRVLEAGGSIELLVATDVRFVRDGELHPADLSSKHARCLVENAALIDVLADVGELVNDKGYGLLSDDPVLR
jgi:hypothetical protein